MHCSVALRSAVGCLAFLLLVVCPAVGGAETPAGSPSFTGEQLEFFEREVRPVLVTHCYECHSGESEKLQGGLRVDSRAAILEGGDTGPAVELESPAESLLVDAINYGDVYQMPPKSKLSDEQIAALTRWVEMGLPWPDEQSSDATTKPADFDLAEREASHWAWKPLQNVAPPAVQNTQWPRDDIDRYVLAKLESEGLQPAPEADRRTWLRRVHFDLIGLPPTPEQVREFLADTDARAYEKVVDRLLNSPHFGERWGRHWLDLVRYSESRGHEFDYDVPNAYQYRDYVIRALNADLPYDRFALEHIAGDLLADPRRHPTEGFNESILGTGFWFMGEWLHSPVDIRKDECDRFDNMIDVFSKTFLGMTVACARCHDHKFDAISQKDYYALAGFLQSSAYRQVAFDTMGANEAIARELHALRTDYHQRLRLALSEHAGAMVQPMTSALAASSTALQTWSRGVAPHVVVDAATQDKLAAELAVQVQAAARDAQLPAELVEYWTRQLLRAAQDRDDPLWLLAQASISPENGLAIAPLLTQWEAHQRIAHEEATASWQGVTTVVDYGRVAPDEWMTDGFAFGLGPIQPGHFLIENGSLQVALHGAARRDPLWSQLALADGVDGEVARLASWNRVGQIARTPTFDLDSRPLHYLIRGSGLAYAVVDSHTMINGPLHGSLLHEIKTADPDTLQWVTHDLRRYAGHNLHIEFSPTSDGPFEVLMVIQADHPPAVPRANAAAATIKQLNLAKPERIEDLVSAYQRIFTEHLQALSTSYPNSENIGNDNALLQWLLRHWQQTTPAAEGNPIRPLIHQFMQEQSKLADQIRKKSHAAPAMWDGTARDEVLLIRGNVKTPGGLVPRRFLEALVGDEPLAVARGSGRLQLAEQVIDPDNPLISRVYVNRIWHHLMGRGIVASNDNFGVLGELPTHPELLDHLALGFIQDGWSTKRLIRRIVLSTTYRTASSPADRTAEVRDPQNKWLHRMAVRRLEGEVIRDALLAISGRLDPTMYGRSVPVHLTPFMQGRGRPGVSGPLDGNGRRSIYIAVRRNFLSPMMLAFDTPQPFSTVGRRSVSNVPAQALIMLNDPLVLEQCERWAHRVLAECGDSTGKAIESLYETAYARPPTADEFAAATEFLTTQGAELGLSAEAARKDPRVWTDLCHVLVNLKEFIFIR